MANDRMRGAAEMTAAMTISGSIGWLVVLSGQPVTDVVFWRCAFGAVTLLAICAALGHLRRDVMSPRQFGIAVLGGVAIVVNWLLLFASYSHASIAVATAVYNTQPFMLIGLGVLFMGERPTASNLVWLGLAFSGVLLIVQAKPSAGYLGADYGVGILLALGAAFFYALATLAAKRLKGVPPHAIALVQVTVGTLMLAPLASVATPPTGTGPWAALVTIGVVHTGVMYILLYSAVQKLPTSVIGALSFVYPVVAILVDLLAFGHRLQPSQLAGTAAILLGAAGITLGWTVIRRRARDAAA